MKQDISSPTNESSEISSIKNPDEQSSTLNINSSSVFTLRSFVQKLFALLVFAGCIITLFTFLGQHWWFLELFSHFEIQYFLAASTFVLFALVMKFKRILFVCVLLVIIHGVEVIPEFISGKPSVPTSTSPSRTYKTIAFNVLRANSSYDEVLQFLKKENADFMALLEVDQDWMDHIKKSFGHYPQLIYKLHEGNHGICYISKFKPVDEKIIFTEGTNIPTVLSSYNFSDKTINLISTHTFPPVHATSHRYFVTQMNMVTELASNLPGETILQGDFNMTPWSNRYDNFLEKGKLRDSRRGFGIQTSWHNDYFFMRIPIDHVWISENIHILDRRVGPACGSDHNPIICEFVIN